MSLGRTCAYALAAAGANAAIVDVREDVGQRTAASIRALCVDVFFVHCDVSDKAQVQDMTGAVVNRCGRMDIGINNPGFGMAPGGSEILEPDKWERILTST
jgi:NAD(P)-dependent dehydrogenase (short-subunit alcohol dehydrogenase family)